MEFRLSGKPAVLVLIAAVVFGGWRMATARADLDTGAAQRLAQVLSAEYAREQLRGVTSYTQLTPARVDSLLATRNITFASITARGRTRQMTVRVEVLVNGRPPADRPVRYYRMRYSPISGWHLDRESNAFGYYSRLF